MIGIYWREAAEREALKDTLQLLGREVVCSEPKWQEGRNTHCDLAIVDLGVLDLFGDPRHEAHEVLQRAHLLELLHLDKEVLEGELSLGEAAGQVGDAAESAGEAVQDAVEN